MSHYQSKLEKLQKSIARVQQHLKGSKKQRSHIMTELKRLEQEISKNARKLKQLEKDIRQVKTTKRRLQTELQQINRDLDRQRSIFAEQIRAAYSMGQQQNLKMLLNQQDPAQVGRTEVYFQYLNRARQQQIEYFLDLFEQKTRTELELQQALEQQQKLLQQQRAQSRKRQLQRQQRKQLLAELTEKIKNQENTLSSLQGSRNRIENLLKSLGELLADIPSSPSEKQPFASLKGKLPWPLRGRFANHFGQAKSVGDLKWNGILIRADYGSPVRVISHGQVAFSDWLQGFGFIVIVDHGDGYMSLYGHNETLLKQSGDWVQAGEIIATAGDSGGQTQSGVYFEIRERGKPVNPARWCSKKARHPSAAPAL